MLPRALLPPLLWGLGPSTPSLPLVAPAAASGWLRESPSETFWASGEALPGSRKSVSVQAPPLTSHVTLVLFSGPHFSYRFPEGVGLGNS